LRDSASFEPLSVKIRMGVFSLRWSEEKNKVTQIVIFHPFSQKSPVTFLPSLEQIFVDIINRDKLFVNMFEGSDFTGVKSSVYPIGN